jgi:RNA polymerase sigma-70 factor (ECF subfamily)
LDHGAGDIHGWAEHPTRARHLKAAISVREVFEQHADFVWRVLARAGVRDADLKDALQEVFIVVANKLDQLDAETRTTTWLYGIAVRVAANQRRKVQRKREDISDVAGESMCAADEENPEAVAIRAQARVQLAELLEELAPEQRIVFEMFELEEMTCPAIADALGIPLGTTYTRLRAARAAIVAKAQRLGETGAPA